MLDLNMYRLGGGGGVVFMLLSVLLQYFTIFQVGWQNYDTHIYVMHMSAV